MHALALEGLGKRSLGELVRGSTVADHGRHTARCSWRPLGPIRPACLGVRGLFCEWELGALLQKRRQFLEHS